MRRLKMGALAALSVAFGLGCSKTSVETPAPAAATGATVTTSTTATLDTSMAKKDSAVGYAASGTTTPATSTTVTTATTTAAPDTMKVATPTTMAPQSVGPQTLQLESQNGSGFTGNVVLTDMGDKTSVTLTLSSPANTNSSMDHNAAIRSGTCAAPGAKLAGLHDVEGNGTASSTEVDYRIGQVADGQHVIVVNENPGDRAVACVAIPSR